MRTKKDEKFKLESVEELLGVVNEESAMDIEISKIQPFRAHPFNSKLLKKVNKIKDRGNYMEQKAEFHYFYGEEADMHSFYRIPKLLFTNDYFKALSNDAKILYGLMLDRMSLSMKNQWFDEENKAYIYFSVEDIMELLNCGKNKAVKTMQELDRETGIGLIEKKRQGLGKANMIYVKNFVLNNKVKHNTGEEYQKILVGSII